jgi:hypothetical protein
MLAAMEFKFLTPDAFTTRKLSEDCAEIAMTLVAEQRLAPLPLTIA